MKRLLILLFSSFLISSIPTSCAIASGSEYETLQSEYEALQSENDELKDQIESLNEYKKNQVLKELETSYAVAWATTAFGDGSSCIFSDDNSYFQCIAEKTFEISEAGISELWSDLLVAVRTLGALSENIQYETISIKFFDPSDTYILDVVLNKEGDSCNLDSITCNILYSDTIISAINNAASN